MKYANHFPTQQSGFTLIELMITITVLTIILFIGSSLTRSWVDRSQVNSAASSLKNAIAQAKTASLRNTDNYPLLKPAVSLCMDNATTSLRVVRNKVSTTTPCSVDGTNNILLQAFPLAQGLSIQQGTSSFDCLSFNPAGIIATEDSSCSIDTTLKFKVEKNDETAEFTIM